MGCSAEKLKRFEVSKQRIGGDRDAAAADDVAPSSGFKKKIKPFNPDIAGFKPKSGSDTGILFRRKSTPSSRRLARECPGGWVDCVDGGVAGNETVSCESECGGECCASGGCGNFTGEVCKDGVSCFGYKACEYAKIDLVVNGCNGTKSCYKAGAGFDGYGYIGEVYNSCLGIQACLLAAGNGGSIGVIQDSCLGYDACIFAAFGGGNIGNISSSCNGTFSCLLAAAYGGSIGGIVDSCLGKSACYYAAACHVHDPKCGSTITEIFDSCEGEEACFKAVYDGGYIGGMKNACNAKEACLGAATFGQNSNISSGINDCCNTYSECDNITEATLPDKCGTTAPTTAPTPTRSSKGGKSKTGKKTLFGKGGKKNNDWKRDEFAFVVDGCMSLHTEKSVFDKRQPV